MTPIYRPLSWCHHSLGIGAGKEGKVPEEPGAESGHRSGGLWIDGGHVRDGLDVAPGVCVRVVEAAVIYVLADKLHCRLVVVLVHLRDRGTQSINHSNII